MARVAVVIATALPALAACFIKPDRPADAVEDGGTALVALDQSLELEGRGGHRTVMSWRSETGTSNRETGL